MAHPMKGTELRDWFKKNGGILYPDENYTSFDYHTLKSPQPVVETADFTIEERKKAYFVATVMTSQYPLNIRETYYLFKYGTQYKLLWLAFSSFFRRLLNLPQLLILFSVRMINRKFSISNKAKQ